MIKILLLARRYWKMILIVTLLIGAISSVWVLYKDNLQLGAGKEIAEVRLRECKSIETNLADRLDRVTSDLRQVQQQRDLLEDDVVSSQQQINIIRREKDQLLFELERRRDIPTECSDKFKWIIGEFQEIERNFYENE